MGKGTVLVVDSLSHGTKELLRQSLEPDITLVCSEGDSEIIDANIKDADVLVSFTKGVSLEQLAKAEKCVLIQKMGAGYNNIPVADASARRIPVCNTPACNSRSVAELALTLMLSVYRQITVGHNAIVQDGKWLKTKLRDKNHELTGKTVGIIGFGNIGRNLCQLLSGFRCNVLYYDAFRPTPEAEKELGVSYREIDDLLRESDVVSLHCPLNEETTHLINAQTLSLMKDDAVLINCARGALVDEDALCAAMQAGKLLGAGLDTFENEPLDAAHPFCKIPNIVLSPHNGGGTIEAVAAVVQCAAENISSILKEGRVAHPNTMVNRAELGL